MGCTTSIPEPELERGDGNPPCEGYDIEAEEKPKTKSKKVEPKEEKPPVTTSASTKDAKSE